VLGLELASMKTRLHRARCQLREILQDKNLHSAIEEND
jgi:DNA-directed RNA polymerase specialized sigma24 family protein